jgi:hypothetical protein
MLSDPSRTICVITTAAMPWRTGTAVNPLLRALYLVRYQLDHSEKDLNEKQSTGSVALVIPWLESSEEREKLYGADKSFANGLEGMKEQEEWIRNYAKERCGMTKESESLKIVWYPAFYLAGFGSIFPKVDLCNFIPQELVDVAILEEPEHLNWFRMPKPGDHIEDDENGDTSNHSGGTEKVVKPKVEVAIDGSSGNAAVSSPLNVISHDDSSHQTSNNGGANATTKPALETAKLGWTHRFRFVVGIVHTNYEAYARQYGIGASLIAAPAIGAVSALTIRAYCHQVIKLSDTLPSFAPGKECTCNVHGVRKEFLEGKAVDYKQLVSDAGEESEEETASVYFIGKLVWAKGFDLMLDVQDIYRKKNKEYFSIDIYGGGPDEKSIARAFHGRHHTSPTRRPNKQLLTPSPSMDTLNNPKDLNAAAVFANPSSIKEQTTKVIDQMKSLHALSDDDVVAQYLSLGFEVSKSTRDVTYVKESRKEEQPPIKDAFNILGDLSAKSVGTGMAVSNAVYNIADSSIKNILKSSFSQLKLPKKKRHVEREKLDTAEETEEIEEKKHFVFDPPQSRWELRRHPCPAKFPGVIDHAQLISVPHKIFLNPSTSEVLCTTTAEALAMGKFVILPKHPSNDFFYQFTNCLAYETLEECAEKLKWALDNLPTPLSEEERHKFTWEAATDRLIASSLVTVREARERAEKGMDKTDARIAFWLSESGEKGNMLRSLFNRKGESSSHPSPNWNDDQA